MDDPRETRLSKRHKAKSTPRWLTFKKIWYQATPILTWGLGIAWRLIKPFIIIAGIAALTFGIYLQWTHPESTDASSQALINTAKANQSTQADQQFNTLNQTQQLALLARWSNPQATGNYAIYMGTPNTIYIKHQTNSSNWADDTVRILDDQNGIYEAAIAQNADANTQPTAVTWRTTAAISKGELYNSYRNDVTAYANRLDLSQRTSADPSK